MHQEWLQFFGLLRHVDDEVSGEFFCNNDLARKTVRWRIEVIGQRLSVLPNDLGSHRKGLENAEDLMASSHVGTDTKNDQAAIRVCEPGHRFGKRDLPLQIHEFVRLCFGF